MMGILRQTSSRALAWLVFFGLASRIFVPQGFMPASIDEGFPIKFCPAAMGGGVHHGGDMPRGESPAMAHDGHDMAADLGLATSEGGEKDPDEGGHEGAPSTVCPLGSIFTWGAFPIVAAALDSGLPPVVAEFGLTADFFVSVDPHARPRPRGPPLSLSTFV